jgi:serine/threonine protein kinase
MVQQGQGSSMEPLAAGTVIGDRYVVGGVLGTGGFGTVYDAQHKYMKRRVAVKLLDRVAPRSDGGVAHRRFLREAESAARIEHPNVVNIYDFGFYGPRGIPYIAMQFLEGRDLREELTAEGAVTTFRTLQLVMGALDGLAEAHELDIVHKDLKPNNLIIVNAGTDRESMRIVDFGLACFAEAESDDSRLTKSGNMLGTPRYLPPEYIKHQTVSPQLDVYQMGLILVEMLTGDPVVQGDSMYNNILAHMSGCLEVPVALVESPLGPILRRALAFDPGKRYPNAGVFRTALSRIDAAAIPNVVGSNLRVPLRDASDETIPPFDLQEFTSDTALVSPSMPSTPPPPPAPKLGLILAGAVGGALLVGALGLAAVWGLDSEPPAPTPNPEQPAATGTAATVAPSPAQPALSPAVVEAQPAAEPEEATPTPSEDKPADADASPETDAAPKAAAPSPATPKRRVAKRKKPKPTPPAAKKKKATPKRLKVVD